VILDNKHYQTSCKIISSSIELFELTKEEFRKIVQTGPNAWKMIKENAEKKGNRIEQIIQIHSPRNQKKTELSAIIEKETARSINKENHDTTTESIKRDIQAPVELSQKSMRKFTEVLLEGSLSRSRSPIRSPEYYPGKPIFRNVETSISMVKRNFGLSFSSMNLKESARKSIQKMHSIGSVTNEDSESILASESVAS
jgi:hypothetical protein